MLFQKKTSRVLVTPIGVYSLELHAVNEFTDYMMSPIIITIMPIKIVSLQ